MSRELEMKFHKDMLNIYDRAVAECKHYRPTTFIKMVRADGGYKTAKNLLSKGKTYGFAELCLEERIDLSVEALILKDEYKPLFTAIELETARKRLEDVGYFPKSESQKEAELSKSTKSRAFEEVWKDILDLLSTTNVIYTITQNKPNTIIRVTDNEIIVRTRNEDESILKDWIALAWNALAEKKSITAEEIPDQARYRSSFIMALLARLEYVRIKRNPVAKLYLDDLKKPEIGGLYPHTYIQSYFSVGNMGGIRYSGSADSTSQCVIITSLNHGTRDREKNPYSDRLVGTKLIYTGEGQTGNQELTKGNLALHNQAVQKYPLFVFERLENDQYKYLGRMQVIETNQEKQEDSTGLLRDVFVFTMQVLSENDLPAAQTSPGTQRNIENDSDLLKKLDGIQSELNKTTVKQEKFKRNKELVDTLKKLYEHKCQLCDPNGVHIPVIQMKDGRNYVEVHHIEGFGEAVNYISENQDEANYNIDHYKNAIVLCVYHHKLLHHYRTKVIFNKENERFTSIDGSLKIPLVMDKHLLR